MTNASVHPYSLLTPELIIDAVEKLGYQSDARLLALNSYENRVYRIGIEDQQPLIVKFYRPERWTDAQILEEHQFCFELAEQELSVVAPIVYNNKSLFYIQQDNVQFRYALFPTQGGHAPELDNDDNLIVLGRFLGRLHNIGKQKAFEERPTITIQDYGINSKALIENDVIPMELKTAYSSLTDDVLSRMQDITDSNSHISNIRSHADCHIGNILWRQNTAHFVDFDDARMAPAIQDLWMLLSGDQHQQRDQLSVLLEGYEEFCEFNTQELALIETLRTLRLMHHAAWLAKRWQDPAFPIAFPWFNSQRYWESHILELREQLAFLQEPPLSLYPS